MIPVKIAPSSGLSMGAAKRALAVIRSTDMIFEQALAAQYDSSLLLMFSHNVSWHKATDARKSEGRGKK